MSWFLALIMLATGVVLPTLNVYTDIAFAVKELARAMANPTRGDHQRLKRLAMESNANF